MPSLTFDKCCLCIELKTGCFIIGYVNLIGCIIATIGTIIAMVGGGIVAANAEDKDTQNVGLVISIAAGIMLIFVLLALAFAIVLLVGLHKNKPGHLKAYLIYSVIYLVVTIINFIIVCATTSITAGVVVQNILTILLGFYFILVIRSMFYQMKDPSRGPAIYSAA